MTGNRGRIPNPESRHDWKDMAVVGRIARPHGLKGQVVINPETDFVEERFAKGAAMWTRSAAGEEQLTVTALRVQNVPKFLAFNLPYVIVPMLLLARMRKEKPFTRQF